MTNNKFISPLKVWAVLLGVFVGCQSAGAVVLNTKQKKCSNGQTYTEYTGLTGVVTGRNAPYRLAVPDQGWDRTLLVYARGTGTLVNLDERGMPIIEDGFPSLGLTPLTNPLPEITANGLQIPGDPLALEEEVLCTRKFAAVATDYMPDPRFVNAGLLGWIVEEGVRDIIAATIEAKIILRHNLGYPLRTLLWARSQGSLIALNHIEGVAGKIRFFDGAVAGCTVGAGASRSWDTAVDLAVAFDIAFRDLGGWQWGTPGDVNDEVVFGGVQPDGSLNGDVVPVLLALLQDPRNFGRFEFLRMVVGLPKDGFYPFEFNGSPGYAGFSWLFTTMLFATEVRASLEIKAGGRIGQNLDHVYSLSEADKGYLAALGVPSAQVNVWLGAMNAATTYSASTAGQLYTKRYKDFTGSLYRPVVSMHTTTDGLALPSQETEYRETVEAAERGRKLRQVYVDANGHCSFTGAEWLRAIDGLSHKLDTGKWPGDDFFSHDPQSGLRFVEGFNPGPFTQPPNP